VAWPGSGSAGEGMELTCGARMSATGVREGGLRGRRTFEEKTYSQEYAKGAHGPDGPMKEMAACGGGGPAWADWAGWAGSQEKIQRKLDF
jgi:hypothetical protein